KKTHSNRILLDKKVRINFSTPFGIISKYRALQEKTPKRSNEVLGLSDEEVSLSRADVTRTRDP
ncbi:MAG: hypothetical protein ACYDCN_16710, partial [Bacteroidia bacterium]